MSTIDSLPPSDQTSTQRRQPEIPVFSENVYSEPTAFQYYQPYEQPRAAPYFQGPMVPFGSLPGPQLNYITAQPHVAPYVPGPMVSLGALPRRQLNYMIPQQMQPRPDRSRQTYNPPGTSQPNVVQYPYPKSPRRQKSKPKARKHRFNPSVAPFTISSPPKSRTKPQNPKTEALQNDNPKSVDSKPPSPRTKASTPPWSPIKGQTVDAAPLEFFVKTTTKRKSKKVSQSKKNGTV